MRFWWTRIWKKDNKDSCKCVRSKHVARGHGSQSVQGSFLKFVVVKLGHYVTIESTIGSVDGVFLVTLRVVALYFCVGLLQEFLVHCLYSVQLVALLALLAVVFASARVEAIVVMFPMVSAMSVVVIMVRSGTNLGQLESIIDVALVAIFQHFVGLIQEAKLVRRIRRVAFIWMAFQGRFLVGLLDLMFGCCPLDP